MLWCSDTTSTLNIGLVSLFEQHIPLIPQHSVY